MAVAIRDALGAATVQLSESGIESARVDAELLLCHVLDCDRTALFIRDSISEDELEELHLYASDLVNELEYEFRINMELQEGTKAKKSKPIRSRRSGIKTQKTIDQNHKILKKFIS
jgi:methylase of polypeptide subunit release factors